MSDGRPDRKILASQVVSATGVDAAAARTVLLHLARLGHLTCSMEVVCRKCEQTAAAYTLEESVTIERDATCPCGHQFTADPEDIIMAFSGAGQATD